MHYSPLNALSFCQHYFFAALALSMHIIHYNERVVDPFFYCKIMKSASQPRILTTLGMKISVLTIEQTTCFDFHDANQADDLYDLDHASSSTIRLSNSNGSPTTQRSQFWLFPCFYGSVFVLN